MKQNEAFPSAYFKADDVKEKPIVLTISECITETVGQGSDARDKCVLLFEGNDKKMVVNATNFALLVGVTGEEDSDDWAGQTIELYNDPSVRNAAGQLVGGVRVRAPRKAKAKAVAAPDGNGDPREGNNKGWTPDTARQHARAVNSGKVPVGAGAPAQPAAEVGDDEDPFDSE